MMDSRLRAVGVDSLSYQLTERHQRVLMAVIRSFVEGAEPV